MWSESMIRSVPQMLKFASLFLWTYYLCSTWLSVGQRWQKVYKPSLTLTSRKSTRRGVDLMMKKWWNWPGASFLSSQSQTIEKETLLIFSEIHLLINPCISGIFSLSFWIVFCCCCCFLSLSVTFLNSTEWAVVSNLKFLYLYVPWLSRPCLALCIYLSLDIAWWFASVWSLGRASLACVFRWRTSESILLCLG